MTSIANSVMPIKQVVTQTVDGNTVNTNFGYTDVPVSDILASVSNVTWNTIDGKPATIAAGATTDAALAAVGLSIEELAADSTASDVEGLKTYVNNLVAKLVASGLFTQAS